MLERELKECLETLRIALAAQPDTPANVIAREAVRIADLLIRKNQDYGCSAWTEPLMAPGIDPRTALQVRMSDKVMRIFSLSKKDATAKVNESIEDTMRDLAGYAILWLSCPQAGVEKSF